MRSPRASSLTLIALFVLAFGLAAYLEPRYQAWQGNRGQDATVLSTLLGDGRKMFANHFFVKADSYFHSGFYPTIFDNREAFQTPHMAEDSGTVGGHNQGDEIGFLGKPRDWIDAFSRQFFPSVHTHLDEGGAQGHTAASGDLGDSSQVREILPWLQLSAELDPNSIQTYTVTAYWLRQRMGKVAEAEAFLRDGLRANPGSYEILFELGRAYAENHHDPARARNLWEAALRHWKTQEANHQEPDKFLFIQITGALALLEEKEGNYPQALACLELWKTRSLNPEQVQQRIQELREKMRSATADSRTP